MQYSKSNLIRRIRKGEVLEYLFFWGHQPSPDGKVTVSCLSQWWQCEFTDGDLRYCCFGSFDKIEELLRRQVPAVCLCMCFNAVIVENTN